MEDFAKNIPLGQLALLGIFVFCLWILSLGTLTWLISYYRKKLREGFYAFGQIRESPLTFSELGFLFSALFAVYLFFVLIIQIHSFIELSGPAYDRFHRIKILQADPLDRLLVPASASLVLYVVLIALVHWLISRKGFSWKTSFGFSMGRLPTDFAHASVAFVATLFSIQILSLISAWILHALHFSVEPQEIIKMLLRVNDDRILALLIILATLGAPFCEELFFRGILYPLLKEKWGPLAGLLINASLFAAIHFHPGSFLPLMALGAAFTLLYEWRGSLAAPIFFHSLFNSASLGMVLLLKGLIPTE